MKVISRFPPSPTGFFHIGSARTALFNYLFAAHHGGIMYLRFEDTDKERSKEEFEKDMQDGIHWLGIEYTTLPEIFRQSERTHVYQKHLKALLDRGAAYEAEDSTDASRGKVIRFKNPNSVMTFTDLIRGDISFDTKELGDFVIARDIKNPLYHLAVVVDDHDMEVSHVIRGEDHISNTPRQMLILEALGFSRPLYAHIPLILAPDRTKLSKRHGALSVNEYRTQGYLREAFVNYLALLGWNPGGDQELFALPELIEKFTLENVQKAGAIFSQEKLQWFNKEYLHKIPMDEFTKQALSVLKDASTARGHTWSDETGARLISILHERISIWNDIRSMVESGELDYFFYDPSLTPADIPQKGSVHGAANKHLAKTAELFEQLSDKEFTNPETIKSIVWDYATQNGRGDVLWPLRYALSGRARSPDPFVIASIIGKETTLRRTKAALKLAAIA